MMKKKNRVNEKRVFEVNLSLSMIKRNGAKQGARSHEITFG